MANYLLLRNERISGPFSLEQLKSLELQSSDQLRIDTDQTHWRSIFEIEALQEWLAGMPMEGLSGNEDNNTLEGFISPGNVQGGNEPATYITCKTSTSVNYKTRNSFPRHSYSDFEENTLMWFIRFLRQKNSLTIASVFIGLVCGTILLKNIVDEIIIHTFPMEQVKMINAPPVAANKEPDKMFQNALVREWITPQTKNRKARPSVARPQEIKNKLSLSANKYKTGFFGGISDLQLTINNTSRHFVNQVEIEICYRKKNGDLVETKNIQVESILPSSSRLVNIPPSLKGVKVSFKILNIYASQPWSLQKQI